MDCSLNKKKHLIPKIFSCWIIIFYFFQDDSSLNLFSSGERDIVCNDNQVLTWIQKKIENVIKYRQQWKAVCWVRKRWGWIACLCTTAHLHLQRPLTVSGGEERQRSSRRHYLGPSFVLPLLMANDCPSLNCQSILSSSMHGSLAYLLIVIYVIQPMVHCVHFIGHLSCWTYELHQNIKIKKKKNG